MQPEELPDSFDLRTEPWIPVTFTDGQERTLSLLDVLLHARDIRSINGDMPLQSPALIRLLLAILYGLYPDGPTVKEWQDLWDAGPFGNDIREYLNEDCRGRWDLFDDETPFLQVANLHTDKGTYSGLEKFILDVPNGNPFFTTRIGEGLSDISYAEAARWLVTIQAFDPSGIKSGAVGDPRVKGGKGYPIGIAWTGNLGLILYEGANLWETLLLNFVGNSLTINGSKLPWHDDAPIWERTQPSASPTPGLNQEQTGDIRCFHGPATLMTWPSRRIRLIRREKRVVGVIIANGDQLKPQMADLYETMTTWRRSAPQEQTLHLPLVYMPRTYTPERSLWRGIANFLPITEQDAPTDSKPSLTSQWLNYLEESGVLPDIRTQLHAYGVVYGSNNSVIDEIVDDTMNMHLQILASHSNDVHECFATAAQQAESGIQICTRFVSNLAAAAGIPATGWRRQAQEQAYSAFDRTYRDWAANIADETQIHAAAEQWRETVRSTLNSLGDAFLAMAPPSAFVGRIDAANTLQSASKADMFFRTAIRKLLASPFPNKSGDKTDNSNPAIPTTQNK